ncbi:MAG: S9 family peptidase [Pseudomonadota bacterium]
MPSILPYGSWPSPISAESVVEGSRSLGSLAADGDFFFWLESRPEEGGRVTIMRRAIAGGDPQEMLPAPFNARTRVQEYGGGSTVVADGRVWFSNFDDQRLYELREGSAPEPITPKEDIRFAGCTLDAPRNRLLCIREDHRPEGEAANTLVAVPLAGMSDGEVLFDKDDFVSAPSLSPDGSRVAFTSWGHPNMPWDNTHLWSAEFDSTGGLKNLTLHNEGMQESVINPQWDKDNQLFAISDRDDWWQIYRVNGSDFSPLSVQLPETEIGGPDWTIGNDHYAILPDGNILARAIKAGVGSLMLLDLDSNAARPFNLASADIIDFLPVDDGVLVINASTDKPPELVETDLDGEVLKVLRTSKDLDLDAAWIPPYQLVSFPVGQDAQAHGIYLPPTNPDYQGPAGNAPPLIVSVHGGPTAVSSPAFWLSGLFWTSRGFAILDLNYRGSTGFGRDYRRALYGEWGVADVEDAVAGVNWLVEQGLADPDRLIIRGGSAGGYTTLAALSFHDAFSAGASYYGISDIEALAKDTHKFESRYLDQLIGPYPERQDLYKERSPINHLDGFDAPLLLLQGLEDRVVPPNQSEMIFTALKSRNVPTAYIAFEGEGHGFRKAENQVTAMQSELNFYSQVLGLNRQEDLGELEIIGLTP